MSFKSIAVFSCDGCKVIESEPVEIKADILQARPPRGWLRVQMNKLTASPGAPDDEALDQLGIKFYCPHCVPLIESYLSGREEEKPQPQPDADNSTVDHFRQQLMRWREKATNALGWAEVEAMLAGVEADHATH